MNEENAPDIKKRLENAIIYFENMPCDIWKKIKDSEQLELIKKLIDIGEPLLINSDYTAVKKENIQEINENKLLLIKKQQRYANDLQ